MWGKEKFLNQTLVVVSNLCPQDLNVVEDEGPRSYAKNFNIRTYILHLKKLFHNDKEYVLEFS
jgi:hypothetical protein